MENEKEIIKPVVMCARCGKTFNGSVNGWFCFECQKKMLEEKSKGKDKRWWMK